jgi:hypothetical protein
MATLVNVVIQSPPSSGITSNATARNAATTTARAAVARSNGTGTRAALPLPGKPVALTPYRVALEYWTTR